MRTSMLALHICAAALGLLSGTAAMTFRKGSNRHRWAGNVFAVSMVCMGAAGSYLALLKHQMNNVFGGIFTCYLVATAWAAGRRRDVQTGAFDWVAMFVGFAVGLAVLAYGIKVAMSPTPPDDGIPAGMYFFMSSVSLLAAAGDVRMLMRGRLAGRPRLTRHLWRMCYGFFIATGAFFLGKQQLFPEVIRKTNLLFILAILPLLLLIFWVVRVRFKTSYSGNDRPPARLIRSVA